ncbi:hypothetical protein GE09DRAFT_559342 [Coniochaeta sp. 2T2.1]|nr:hypothetical protein GE09DRAFT_559342 [Coniochaeta sp. 2T2.1]
MSRSELVPEPSSEPAAMPDMPRTPTPEFDRTDRVRTRSLTPTSLAHGPADLGSSNRTSDWPSPAPSQVDRPAVVHGDDFRADRSFGGPSSISPSDDDRGDIPIALAPGPQRFSASSPPPPPLPSAPIAGTAHIAEQYRPQQYRQREHQTQPQPYSNQYEQDIYQPQARSQPHTTTFLQPQPSLPSRARMPFMPDPPTSPDQQEAIKFSRVRAHRPALKSSKRLPSPQPSPTVYDNGSGYDEHQLPPPPSRTRTLEKQSPSSFDRTESAGSGSETKRKTLFQRALEGWWDLPGLLNRGDTVKGRRRVPERRLGKNEFF